MAISIISLVVSVLALSVSCLALIKLNKFYKQFKEEDITVEKGDNVLIGNRNF